MYISFFLPLPCSDGPLRGIARAEHSVVRTNSLSRADLTLVLAGYALVLLYVLLMLGPLNAVQHRALLSLVGVFSVAMGLGSGFGLCLYFDVMYTDLHQGRVRKKYLHLPKETKKGQNG